MQKYSVVFVSPQYEDLKNSFMGITNNIGAAYIRAYLKARNIETMQYIRTPDVTLPVIVEEIMSYNTSLVGFTCYDKTYYINKLICRELKKLNPDITTIFGGPTPSSADYLIMEDEPEIDICVRHEGEQTMYELIDRLSRNLPVDDVQGISYRKDGRIIRNADRPQLASGERGGELDFLPSPYQMNMLSTDTAVVQLVSSRGCPYSCIFCNNSIMGRHNIRYHSIDYIMKDLRYINVAANGKPVTAFFVDDAFTININRAKEICKRIIAENFTNLSFICQTRIDYADGELFSLFKAAGFTEIAFGLDTASPRLLNLIKKVRNTSGEKDGYAKEKKFLDDYRNNIRLAREEGLDTYVSVIFGLPTETEDEARTTLAFVRDLAVKGYTHNLLQVFTGTEVANRIGPDHIAPTAYLLPYKVTYPYDVHKLPHLDNSMHRRLFLETNHKDHMDFFHLWGLSACTERERALRIVGLENYKAPPSVVLADFLKKNIKLDTIFFFIDNTVQSDEQDIHTQELAMMEVPLRKYNQVRISTPSPGLPPKTIKVNDLFTEYQREEFDFTYLLEPFSGFSEEVEKYNTIHIKQINSEKSLNAFIEEMEILTSFDIHEIPKLLEHYYYIEDKCRWSCAFCRARRLHSLFINENEKIRPCLHGRSIGTVQDTVDDLFITIKNIEKEMIDRRGCNTCAVEHVCSKCLFLPDFLSEREYCRIRKEYPHIYKTVELKQIAYQILFYSKTGQLKFDAFHELQISGLFSNLFYTGEKISCSNHGNYRVRKDYILFRLDNNYFFYNISKTRLLRLSDKLACIFEFMDNRPGCDKEELSVWVRENYRMDESEASQMLDKALLMLKNMNVINID
ncbi:MAG: radical SAM protein [Spirochaetales bacterium]|nr:radical SAM protein [Spirochaetales bacterium]